MRDEADKNAGGPPGAGLVPANVRRGVRVNAAMAYVLPHRDRPNLVVRGGTGVERVLFDGDRAVAICESVLLVRHKDRIFPARIGANRIELVRTPEGWRTTRRTTRGLDGSAESHALLGATAPTNA